MMNYQRRDIEFRSQRDICRAWLYVPTQPSIVPTPCIVMAHGLGGTRDAGLEPYAHRFAEAGFVVLLFDYRHFGASDGEPRQLSSIKRQLQDWKNAIDHCRRIPGVDKAKIALWGTSLSGGHVIVAAARDGNIAALSAQNPMMDAVAALALNVRYAGLGALLKIIGLGVLDQARAALGLSPVYVPLVALPGHLAALPSPDALAGYMAIAPPHWRNEICARLALTILFYRPIVQSTTITCPALIQVCTRDSVVSVSAAAAAARRIGVRAGLKQYDCGHFDIYVGRDLERACSDQIAFFNRVLPGKG